MEHKIRLAIVSDLHCHPEANSFKENDSYLFTNSLRKNDHPIESLERQLRDVEADLIIAPGDFTNKADRQGFISGWNYVTEIKDILKAQDIVATLGNHDVDSGNNYSNYSLEIAKGIRRNFPLKDDRQRDEFWSKGCTFYEHDCCRILVINSCHFHYSRAAAGGGKVDDDMLNYIDLYLEDNQDNKILVALVHHHPILHDRQKLGEFDLIVNGSELLTKLAKYKFDLLIHGHKHDPLLRYCTPTGTSYRLPIFSSGSFAALSNNLWCGSRNFFHILEINKNDNAVNCQINSWTYFPQNGWKYIYDESAYPPYSGFGNTKKIKVIAEEIFEKMTNPIMDWEEIQILVPEVKYLIPIEMDQLYDELKSKKVYLDKVIGNFPEKIFKI
ncbi:MULTISPECIES: metallophosphoesterase family protein [unclassified Chryseobacterium]|uniref:metallophosphoesterase family protein n=1 Tax=unclassified Chryseobacterium TaxID=2593645 RepID=UPI0028534B2A|nr:metallophosphoesterase [Chryseobacterium sp. CFS7]MDR4892717.1 metallophosphoesterase [Chryseobacterium sp. CFS7]